MASTDTTYNLNIIAEDYASAAVDAAVWEAREDDADPHAWDLDDIIDAANEYAWQTVDGCAEVIYHYHAARIVAENLSEAETAAEALGMGDSIAEHVRNGDLCNALTLYAFALILDAVQSLVPDVAQARIDAERADAEPEEDADA